MLAFGFFIFILDNEVINLFSTIKFGGFLSRLRKNADMTQSELAEKLSVTRQAISDYERGNSFPDITILILITEIFNISLDELINSGEPTMGEAYILKSIADEKDEINVNIDEVKSLAPLLKPSILENLATGLAKNGIDISNIVSLAEYLNDKSVIALLKNANFETVDDKLLSNLMPLLDERSKSMIFQKILDGEMDWHLIKVMLPYADYLISYIEAAVIEGALPKEALKVVHNYIFKNEV